MKKFGLLTLLGVILVIGTLAGCENKQNQNLGTNNQGNVIIEDSTPTDDAVIYYNDSLLEIASQCSMSEEDIQQDYESGLENIQVAVNNTIAQCQNSINQINQLGDREGDGSLKEGIIKVLELDIAYFSKFNEILPYLAEEEVSEADAEKYNTLVEEIRAIEQEMEDSNNELMGIQEDFAARHNYELQPIEE